MEQKLKLTIDPGQVITVTLSGFAEGISVSPAAIDALAIERTAALVREEVLMRVYHTGVKPTADLSYDDRLFKRIKCSQHTAYIYLNLPVKRGGIRHMRVGSKYLITEQAVREWFGDTPVA